MAFNAFLQINSPTVAGEATQANFTGWIEIYSFSWGVFESDDCQLRGRRGCPLERSRSPASTS